MKGLLTYMEAREQLIRALPLVANGGFWVPRQLLSGFVDVDSILTSQGRRLKTDSVANLSRQEQEVLDSLLQNLSNKEIASKLNIAERTVKFHVSNLLNKVGNGDNAPAQSRIGKSPGMLELSFPSSDAMRF